MKKNQAPVQKTQGLRLVTESREWFRDQYRRSLSLCNVLGICLGLSILLNGVQFVMQPQPKFFASTPDLRLAPMTPLDQPVITPGGLLNWAAEVTVDTLGLNFQNWRRQLQTVQGNYSEKAWTELLRSLKDAKIIEWLEREKLSVSAVVNKAPIIIASGIINGVLTWRIEVPVTTSYESSRGVVNNSNLLAKIMVQRVPTTEIPRGVKITQFVLVTI